VVRLDEPPHSLGRVISPNEWRKGCSVRRSRNVGVFFD